ncbi:MAG: GMP synthase [Kiloniellaceae bacterium]
MTKIVVLVDHPVGKRDDRASRRLVERGYRVEWVRPADGERLPEPGPEHAGAIVYGGAESANDDAAKPYIRAELDWIARWLDSGKPYLGFCLGGQLLARVLGAAVRPHPEGFYEIGYVPVAPTAAADGFLGGLRHVYHWHKEGFEVPGGATLLATGPTFPNQAFRAGRDAYALQFHPEVTLGVMTRWMDEAAHMLDNPNAHPRERQLADAAKYDALMAAWLDRFLRHWLSDSD